MKHLFGPVPSQRLGISLVIDPIPKKVCTFDCIYCEVARTSYRTLERKQYIPTREILDEVREGLERNPGRPDYITFSGSGEPTLHCDLGRMIRAIQQMTSAKVAVITNSSTLFMPDVRADLKAADVVLPSLDSAIPETYRKINRPLPEITLERIIGGLEQFSKEYAGQMWLEVLLVKNVNDNEREYRALAEVISRIAPDRVDITTVTRPPGFGRASPAALEELHKLREILGPIARVTVSFAGTAKHEIPRGSEEAILELLKIRACTIEDMAKSTGLSEEEIRRYLNKFKERGVLEIIEFQNGVFYKIQSDFEYAPE